MNCYDDDPYIQQQRCNRRVVEMRRAQRAYFDVEAAKLREEMQADLAEARAEFNAEVAALREELYRLREWYARANNELAEVQRMRAFTAFQMAQRDEATPLQ